MTAQTTLAPTPELTPLADFLSGVLKKLRPLPPLDLDLTQAYGNVLAEDVRGPTGLPAFDRASIDGYAARSEDLLLRILLFLLDELSKAALYSDADDLPADRSFPAAD